jgi:hypothetical protein
MNIFVLTGAGLSAERAWAPSETRMVGSGRALRSNEAGRSGCFR